MSVRFAGVNRSYTAALNLGTVTEFSITAWVRLAADRNTYSSFWCVDPGTTTDYALMQTDADGTTVNLYPSVGALGALTVGTWYFIGVSWSAAGGVAKKRALGAASFTTYNLTTPPVNLTNLRLGVSVFSSNEWLNGNLSTVKMWTGAALSAAELEAEYLYDAPLRTANLRAFYRFATASTVDNSGNGYTLTGGSGATTEADPTGLIPVPAPDTQAPTTPTGLAVSTVAHNSVTLTWSASTDNVGVAGYEIYRDGALAGTVGAVTTYTDAGRSASTTYAYKVRAKDGSNNLSGFTSEVQATTLQAPSEIVENFEDTTYNIQFSGSWGRVTDASHSVGGSLAPINPVDGDNNDVIVQIPSGAQTVQFWYKLQAFEVGFDFFQVNVGSDIRLVDDVDVNWKQSEVIDVTGETEMTLRFFYGDTGLCWVDDITFTFANSQPETMVVHGWGPVPIF